MATGSDIFTDSSSKILEANLIGGLAVDQKNYPEIASFLRADDFATGHGKVCWATIAKMFGRESIDFASLYAAIPSEPAREWFLNAIDCVPVGLVQTARRVHQLSRQRSLATALSALANDAARIGTNPDHALEDVQRMYSKLAARCNTDQSAAAVVDRFHAEVAKNRSAGSVGIDTGFDLLRQDQITYQPGHIWIIGAWTSVGKTAFMVEAISRQITSGSARMAVFSTEMTEQQNIARIIANMTGLGANAILSGRLMGHHQDMANAAAARIAAADLWIYDQIRDVDDLLSEVRRLQYARGIDLVFVDFVQNLKRRGGSNQSRYEKSADMAIDLQQSAIDMRYTMVCLSQIPNAAGREDSGILEFKGAGEFAAACDIGVWMKRGKDDKSEILFDVRKNRHGPLGQYLFGYQDGYTRLEEKSKIKW